MEAKSSGAAERAVCTARDRGGDWMLGADGKAGVPGNVEKMPFPKIRPRVASGNPIAPAAPCHLRGGFLAIPDLSLPTLAQTHNNLPSLLPTCLLSLSLPSLPPISGQLQLLPTRPLSDPTANCVGAYPEGRHSTLYSLHQHRISNYVARLSHQST
ncbi:hypothetical protein VTI28DRAFT_7308 [Corynascus sepedonium]